MRTNTRRALQLATVVLAGAGAMTASAGAASATETLTLSRSSALSAAQVADLSHVTLRDALRPPIWCCGNLGPLTKLPVDPDGAVPPIDIAEVGGPVAGG